MTTYADPKVTEADLEFLSGRPTPAAQRRWLDENGIRYVLSRDGRPRTTWGAVDAALLGTGATQDGAGINLDAVR